MKFSKGQRVRTTVDAPTAWEGAFSAPAGTLGTVDWVHEDGYGVLLDGDPDALSAYFKSDELQTAN